jgi:hypothetical protein
MLHYQYNQRKRYKNISTSYIAPFTILVIIITLGSIGQLVILHEIRLIRIITLILPVKNRALKD